MYLRARWYDAQNGRFNRLDPFFGNLSDPQSLHKYAYVHGDPIQGTDPTGKSLLVNVTVTGGIIGTIVGGGYGALRGFADTITDPDASWGDVIWNTVSGMFFGALFGGAAGAALGALTLTGPYLPAVAITGMGVFGVRNNYNAVKQSLNKGNYAQASVRTIFGALDVFMAFMGVRGIAVAKSPALTMQTSRLSAPRGYLAGKKVDAATLAVVKLIMGRLGVKFEIVPASQQGIRGNPRAVGGYQASSRTIFLKSDSPYTILIHEMFHAIHHLAAGSRYNGLSGRQKADFVRDNTLALFKWMFNSKEIEYINWTHTNESRIP